jgi:hypothetical protein
MEKKVHGRKKVSWKEGSFLVGDTHIRQEVS